MWMYTETMDGKTIDINDKVAFINNKRHNFGEI